MNIDEALAEAIVGERVRAVDMQPGVYIDYHFNGWRINFPSGDSSGYSHREHDKTVEWEIWEAPKPQGWASYPTPPVPASEPPKRGRRTKPVDLPINDIGDWRNLAASPAKASEPECPPHSWTEHPCPDAGQEGKEYCELCGTEKPASEGWPSLKPTAVPPGFETGSAEELAAQGGWPIMKDKADG